MTKILCLLAGLFSLACGPALAADNYVITSGGAQRTVRAKDVGGILVQMSMPTDATGTPYSGTNGLPVAQQGTWTFGLSGPVTLANGTTVTVSGVALAAKQPALGTAGSASADVLTVQGIANGTPLPVTGTFTANASLTGTYNSTPPTLSNGASSALQLDASGNLKVAGSFAATTSGVVATSAPSYSNGSTQSLSLTTAGGLRVDGSGVTQPVSMAAAPTGAATSALQTTGNTSLASLDSKAPALTSGRVPVDGSGVTQPVSASALPLPAGAATAANQATANTSLASIDSKTPALVNGAQPVDTVVRVLSVNRGGTLTTANTAVTLIPANSNRRGLAIQNRNAPTGTYNAATSVFMSCLGTATADFNSLEIPAGALYETPAHHAGTGACSFISATASTPVYIREF